MISDITRVLERGLAEDPDRQAVVGRSGSLGYAQLDAAADRAAAALWAAGVRPGDRIAATLGNDLPVVTAFHGAMRIGAIWVGIGAALAPPERAHLLADCDPAIVLDETPESLERWAGLLRDAPEAPRVEIDPRAPAGIAYTSGTTGTPKGIVHSQANLLLPGAVLVADRGYGANLRKGDCLPLTILNLLVLSTLLTAQAGGCCVVMDRRDPAGVADWIRRERITTWNGVPAQLYDLVRRPEIDLADLASLDELWSGGGDCSDDLRREVEARLGLPVRGTYGLTEAPTVVAIDPPGSAWRPGSSGRPLPHLDVRVVDSDGSEVAPGEVGELAVSAKRDGAWAGAWQPSLGVWGDGGVRPGTSSAELLTGDLGLVDAEGWLHVRDRRTALIIRGGANVYPAEVERAILTLPDVAGAAVIGIPDERLGERVGVIIEPLPGTNPDVETLREACETLLSKYKIPEVWTVVPELPRNGMGKVIRRELLPLLKNLEHA